MATDPGRSPRPARATTKGRSGVNQGGDPTNMPGQVPAEVFGFTNPQTTGAPGSPGAHAGGRDEGPGADVTVLPGQLDEGFSGLHGTPITDTGVPGGHGIVNEGGGETVRFTDSFALAGYGNDASQMTATGHISGDGDWTQANTEGYAGGPTLPGLENARPTSTGAGRGTARTERP